jgi:hemerythrin-like domain-containing protein
MMFAPAFGDRITTHPLHTLKHEHRVIERALRALDGVCTRLEWGQHVPAEVLLQLVDFINTFADRYHHGKEETYLFPALQKEGIPRDGALASLEHEHQIESNLAAEMRLATEEYRSVDPAARQRFIDAARRYTNHLLGHIEREDSILFMLADEILDEDDKASLREGFKRAEAELGAGASEKYDRIASALEQQWAV